MKNYLLSFCTICLLTLLFTQRGFALTPTTAPLSPTPSTTTKTTTPTSQPQDTGILNSIQKLKDKIASRVAQLKLVEKRGIIGTINDASSTQISMNDLQNNMRFVDVDEITKFSAPGKDSFGVSDLTKGTLVSVLGLYNKDSRRITARFVDVIALPHYITGTIATIDKKNGQFMVTVKDGSQTKIDVENITKTYTFAKASDLTKMGFSKLQIGDKVFIMGYPDKKDTTMIIASRIIQLADLGANPPTEATGTTSPTNAISPTVSTTLKTKVTPTK